LNNISNILNLVPNSNIFPLNRVPTKINEINPNSVKWNNGRNENNVIIFNNMIISKSENINKDKNIFFVIIELNNRNNEAKKEK
jgi:hypothetical protein